MRRAITACLALAMCCGVVFSQEVDEDPSVAGWVSAATTAKKIETDQDEEALRAGATALFGESLVTSGNGAAWLALREGRGVVHIGNDSTVIVSAVQPDEQIVAIAVGLVQGTVTIMARSNESRPLFIALGEGGASGYALLRGGTLNAEVRGGMGRVTARSGAVSLYAGPMPEEGVLNAEGAPAGAAVLTLSAGEQAVLPAMTKESATAVSGATGLNLYASSLTSAAEWVVSAEQGDLTPKRAESRGEVSSFLEQTSSEFSFDQARPPVPVTTRSVTAIVTNIRANPAEALVASGIPTEVVVGQRFFRTRIIGSPGTGDSGIRINPDARSPIVLGN